MDVSYLSSLQSALSVPDCIYWEASLFHTVLVEGALIPLII